MSSPYRTVYTWELRKGATKLNLLMVDNLLFSLFSPVDYGPLDVTCKIYPDAVAAREGAVRVTGYSEGDGLTLEDGMWVCDIQVDTPYLQNLVARKDNAKAVVLLRQIIGAAHIIGRHHQ